MENAGLRLALYASAGLCLLVLSVLSRQSRPLSHTPMAITPQHHHPHGDSGNTTQHWQRLPSSLTNGSYLYWNPQGRLGNQIFEFTTAFCTALQSNHTPTILADSNLLSLFQIPDAARVVNNDGRRPQVFEYKCCFQQPHILEAAAKATGEIKLQGFFHSYKYMLPCWPAVQKQLVLSGEIQAKVQKHMASALLEVYANNNNVAPSGGSSSVLNSRSSVGLRLGNILNRTFTFVGVHIRRTDRRATYPPVGFFKRAFRYYEEKYPNIVFFVCSDDINWCEKELPGLTKSTILFMSRRTQDYRVDFGILTNCHHSIVTAGTFSWWSGWLAGGEVVYHTGYNDWQNKLHPDRYKQEDFYPETWTAMDEMGARNSSY